MFAKLVVISNEFTVQCMLYGTGNMAVSNIPSNNHHTALLPTTHHFNVTHLVNASLLPDEMKRWETLLCCYLVLM